MPVYLLHFDRPLAHAQHYIGYSVSPESLIFRISDHRAGVSRAGGRYVAIMRALHEAGIGFSLARTWPDADRGFERRLKRRFGGIRPACPVCSGESAYLLANSSSKDQQCTPG